MMTNRLGTQFFVSLSSHPVSVTHGIRHALDQIAGTQRYFSYSTAIVLLTSVYFNRPKAFVESGCADSHNPWRNGQPTDLDHNLSDSSHNIHFEKKVTSFAAVSALSQLQRSHLHVVAL